MAEIQNMIKDNEDPKPPTYFDFEPLLKSVKLFIECDANT
jgi:hypothetical protein